MRLPLNTPLHPTQIYESIACVIIFGVLVTMAARKRFNGQIALAYVALYAIARFIIEFYRGDSRGLVTMLGSALSTSQFVSLLLVPLSIVMLVVLSRRRGPAPVNTATGRARAA